MSTSSSADGWWGLLLGGAVGSLIGGAATFIAVWLTIRHERRLRNEQRLEDAVASANAAAGRLMANFASGRALTPDGLDIYTEFLHGLSTLTIFAQRFAPPFAQLLKDGMLNLTDAVNRVDGSHGRTEDVRVACATLHLALARWIVDPKQFTSGRLQIEQLRKITLAALENPTNESAEADALARRPGRIARWFGRR